MPWSTAAAFKWQDNYFLVDSKPDHKILLGAHFIFRSKGEVSSSFLFLFMP